MDDAMCDCGAEARQQMLGAVDNGEGHRLGERWACKQVPEALRDDVAALIDLAVERAQVRARSGTTRAGAALVERELIDLGLGRPANG